jgi:hypothetical protein
MSTLEFVTELLLPALASDLARIVRRQGRTVFVQCDTNIAQLNNDVVDESM